MRHNSSHKEKGSLKRLKSLELYSAVKVLPSWKKEIKSTFDIQLFAVQLYDPPRSIMELLWFVNFAGRNLH